MTKQLFVRYYVEVEKEVEIELPDGIDSFDDLDKDEQSELLANADPTGETEVGRQTITLIQEI